MKISAALSFIVISSFLTVNAVANIREVNTDANKPSATSEQTRVSDSRKTTTPKEDAIITKSINKHIKKSRTLSGLKVNVATHDGVVSLSGNVDSDTQASALIELSESIIGVRDTDASKLTIAKSTQPFKDMMTTAKIKGLFVREKLFGETDIAAINTHVETKNGVVYLSGRVKNNAQIQNAIKIIKEKVPAVKRVEYNIEKFVPFTNQPGNANKDTNEEHKVAGR